jgi:hypothetical protein
LEGRHSCPESRRADKYARKWSKRKEKEKKICKLIGGVLIAL